MQAEKASSSPMWVNSKVGHNQELPGNMTMHLLVKILVMIGSSVSIGFGIWHFFVPTACNWFSYVNSNATELVAAVRIMQAFLL
jgi:hypothetical protein